MLCVRWSLLLFCLSVGCSEDGDAVPPAAAEAPVPAAAEASPAAVVDGSKPGGEDATKAEGALPAHLVALMEQVEAEKMDYPERARDVRWMKEYIESGEYDSAARTARGIIEQQDNLR